MIHKLLKRPQAIIGLGLIAIVIVIAIAAPVIYAQQAFSKQIGWMPLVIS